MYIWAIFRCIRCSILGSDKVKLLESNSMLIIFHYVPDYQNLHVLLTSRYINNIKKTFYENSKASEDEISKIDDKVIVEINHILFTK